MPCLAAARSSSRLSRAGLIGGFARDLGLNPDDPAGALDAFTDGIESRIALGEVNGRLFLNSVSLGLYGQAVRQSAYRDAKVRTLLETVRAVLGPGGEIPELALVDDDLGAEHSNPAVVLVSNNAYGLTPPMERCARPTLDSGRLGIIVIDAPAGSQPPRWRAWSATSLEVGAPATPHVGIDGEALDMSAEALRRAIGSQPTTPRPKPPIAARRIPQR